MQRALILVVVTSLNIGLGCHEQQRNAAIYEPAIEVGDRLRIYGYMDYAVAVDVPTREDPIAFDCIVASDGTIMLPQMGTIKAVGLTTQQLESTIKSSANTAEMQSYDFDVEWLGHFNTDEMCPACREASGVHRHSGATQMQQGSSAEPITVSILRLDFDHHVTVATPNDDGLIFVQGVGHVRAGGVSTKTIRSQIVEIIGGRGPGNTHATDVMVYEGAVDPAALKAGLSQRRAQMTKRLLDRLNE